MTKHKAHAKARRARFDISLLTEAIDHELRPHVESHGGELWLQEVLPERVIISFRHPDGDAEGLRRWLHAALVRLFGGNEAAFELRMA